MEPLEVLEEAVKSKSWPMVRLALKGLKEQKQNLPNYTKPIETTTIVHAPSVSYNRPNLFFDDGNTVEIKSVKRDKSGNEIIVGSTSLDTFEEDKKLKPKKGTERNRPEYKEKHLTCSRCNRPSEVDSITYTYHTRGAEKGDAPIPYVCQKCM